MRTPRNQTRFRIGAWTVDPAANLLEQGRHSVRLESRAMDVLTCLASRGGAVTSVDELMSTVWKGVVVGDGSVYLAISQLRQALGDLDGKSYIETVPRRGYLLTVAVEPAGQKPRRRWPLAATAVGLALAVGLLAWILRPQASVPSIGQTQAVSRSRTWGMMVKPMSPISPGIASPIRSQRYPGRSRR